MKCIITILSILISSVSLAQLSVKPTGTGDDTFIYVIDEILYVKEDINLTKNINDTLTEASIYLRREAQLIQGDGADQDNKGNGYLSVFQEGTTNQWDYNNWTSPVSVTENSLGATLPDGNTTFGPITLYTPVDKTYSSPVKLIGGFESSVGDASAMPDPEPLSLPSYWFFYYPTGNDYLGWQQVGGDDYTIPAGYGFTMKGVTGADPTISDTEEGIANNLGSSQRFDFRGRPNSGTILIGDITPITPGHSVFIGNPYPSALDLSYFLLEHSINTEIDDDNDPDTPDVPVTSTSCGSITRKDNTTGIAYFYDSDPTVQSHYLVDYQAGYEAFAPVDCGTTGMSVGATFIMYTNDGEPIANSETGVEGDARDRRYLPIAQGFFVETTNNLDNSFTFENRHRTYVPETASANSTFHRNSASQNITTENFDEDELIVIPKLKLNIELNHAYNRQISIGFWHNSSQGVDYAMDARLRNSLPSDAAILNNNDKYYIDVRPFDVTEEIPLALNIESQMDVKFTATSFENFNTENVYILDSETGVYYDINYNSWTTTLQPGNYDGRFFLTFQEQEVLDTKDFAADNFDVFQNNSASQLEIRNPNALYLKSVAVFDIAGKKVINERNLEGQSVYTFSTRNLQEAIYVVNITTSDNISFSKKITVSNNR